MSDDSENTREEFIKMTRLLGSRNYSLPAEVRQEIDKHMDELIELAKKHNFPFLLAAGMSSDEEYHGIATARYGDLDSLSLAMWVATQIFQQAENDTPIHIALLYMSVIAALKETDDLKVADVILDRINPILKAYEFAEKLEKKFESNLESAEVSEEQKGKAREIIDLFNQAFDNEIKKGWVDEKTDPEDS